jgi:CDP-diglyceride synthetase
MDNLLKNEDHRRRIIWTYKMLHLRRDRDMKVAFASGIVGGIVLTILNTLLLVGIHKEKKHLVRIWLWAYFVFIVLSVLSLCFNFFQFFANPYRQVGAVISIGLTLYFLLVVRSYHQSLADGRSRQHNAANVYHTENSNIKRMPLA